MSYLFELLQKAHTEARKLANGDAVTYLHLSQNNGYKADHSLSIEIKALFGYNSQNLKNITALLVDCPTTEPIKPEELESILGYIPIPTQLTIQASGLDDPLREYRADLSIKRVGPVLVTQFKRVKDGSIDYSQLSKILRLPLNGAKRTWDWRILGSIDASQIPNAHKWAFDSGLIIRTILSGQDGRHLHIDGAIHSSDPLTIYNGIRFEAKIDPSTAQEQVAAIEAGLQAYNSTYLEEMPFAVQRVY